MKSNSKIASRLRLVAALILTIPTFALGQSEFVIYSFPNTGLQGAGPSGNLITDSAGNLYGTTFTGGAHSEGTVFEMIRPVAPSTAWTQQVLYSFATTSPAGTGDGTNPVAGLVFDGSGNLYGTASRGGAFAFGAVFELSPPASPGGAWTENLIYSFKGTKQKDGSRPFAGLLFDPSGHLFGATTTGGVKTTACPDGCGTVFELMPPATSGGAWTESVIHTFFSAGGTTLSSGLVRDGQGYLYGTAETGGANNAGTVYRLKPPATTGGTWGFRVLYNFGNAASGDGQFPADTLTLNKGNLYGTTSEGGASQLGTVFELVRPAPGGAWTENLLYSFVGGSDGEFPFSNVTFDRLGNIYGTTQVGGGEGADLCGDNGCGTVYKLTQPTSPGGSWTESVVHSFPTPESTDGTEPYAGLVLAPNGVLYGVSGGGLNNSNLGTVFGIVR